MFNNNQTLQTSQISEHIYTLASDGIKSYDLPKKIQTYSLLIETGSLNILLKYFPEFVNDVKNDQSLTLSIISTFINSKIVVYDWLTERVCMIIENGLKNNMMPPMFIANIKFHEMFIQLIIRHNNKIVRMLLEAEQIILNSVIFDVAGKNIYETMKRFISFDLLKDFIKDCNIEAYNIYPILLDHPNLVNYLNEKSFDDLFSFISQNQTSFDKQTGGAIKLKLNSQIFLMALVNGSDENFIINCYKNIEKKIKFKILLSFKETNDYFFDNFHKINFHVVKALCETKGVTIANIYFERLLHDDFSNKIKDKGFCVNLITLINECKITISEFIKSGDITKEIIAEKINEIIHLHVTLTVMVTLPVISMLDLHGLIISEEKEIELLFNTLQNYSFSDDNASLSSVNILLVRKLLENNNYFPFLDANIVVNFLSELYRENIENIQKLAEIKTLVRDLAPKLNTYNSSDVALLIKRLIKSNTVTIADEFIDLYFEVVPAVKNIVIANLHKHIKMEAHLIKNVESDYDSNSNLSQVCNLLTSGSLKNFEAEEIAKLPHKLFDIEIDENLITGEKIKELLNAEGCNSFKTDSLICQLCLENYVDTALYPCGHVLCSKCLSNLPKYSIKRCPTCSTKDVVSMKLYIG